MTNPADDGERELVHLLDRALRDLPVRHAPRALESRVFDALARRAALPWWRQSFGHWPRYARTLFFALCAALNAVAFAAGAWITAGIGSAQAWRQASAVLAAAATLSASIARALPPAWLYEGAAVAIVLYAVLFALGPPHTEHCGLICEHSHDEIDIATGADSVLCHCRQRAGARR